MKDLNLDLRPYSSVAPAAISADTDGSVISLADADSLVLSVPVGVVTTADASNYITVKAMFGDAADGSDATEVTDNYLDPKSQANAIWDRKINATTEGPMNYQIGLKNTTNKAYCFARLTKTGTVNMIMGANLIIGSRRHQVAAA